MNELLNELLAMLDQNVIRICPYTLEDSQRPAIEARIDDWTRRARAFEKLETAHSDELDPKHCYLCDRPKLDCACEVTA